MHEIPSPSVIFMDVFSLLTLAMFVLFSISSGADTDSGKGTLTVIDVRLALVPQFANRSVSELVEFDIVPEDITPGPRPRLTVERTEFGLQLICEGEFAGELRLIVKRVLEPMALGRDIRGIAEVQGESSTPVAGRLGAWDDPIIFSRGSLAH